MTHQKLRDALAAGVASGNIADAMKRLGLPGGAIPEIAPLGQRQRPFAGWARTVQQVPWQGGVTRQAEVIDRLEEGDVLVIDVGARRDVCSMGFLLALRGRIRGAAGFVVNGCVRDADQIVAEEIGVHCLGSAPVGSSQVLESAAVDEPIEIGGVIVKFGDLIFADASGVVCVPSANASNVLEVAARIALLEADVEKAIRQGSSFAEAWRTTE